MNSELIIITDYINQTRIEQSFITSLEEYGLIHIYKVENEQFLHHDELSQLEKYARMYYDLSINVEGIDAINHLIEKINDLNDELRTLKNKLDLLDI